MGFAEACRWVGEQPAFAWARRSRATRRGVVVALVLVLAAFPALGWVLDYEWLLVALLAPYLFLVVALAGATGGLADLPASHLDERQRSQRDAAFANAYWVGAIGGLLGGGVMVWAATGDFPGGFAGGVFIGVVGFVTALPSMVLGWRLPDEVADADV